MIRSSKDVLKDLLLYGADFEKDENGELVYTREGAHSAKRIVYHKDVTGKEITETLYDEVLSRPNITIMENTELKDLLISNDRCVGGIVHKEDIASEDVSANCVMKAFQMACS